MTDIVSTPPAPASPEGALVLADGWWPDIDVNAVREELRLGGTTVPHARLAASLRIALSEVMRELADWRAPLAAAGAARLAEVDPSRTIDNDPELEVLFVRAVSAWAAADLAERHIDVTATQHGASQAEQRGSMADAFRRDFTRAVRAIRGETGVLVDLV